MSAVADRLRALGASGALELPLPGRGHTAERHRRLAQLTRVETVSVGRLAEAHVDALAILAEAGLSPEPGALYGVWASQKLAKNEPALNTTAGTITGVKHFCSGAGVVDRALVTAIGREGDRVLVDVGVSLGVTMATTTDTWTTAALADTHTADATFVGHPVGRVVGTSGWYVHRPGFWDGACGPAACWAGAALGLVDAAVSLAGDEVERLQDLGAMVAAAWAMRGLLAQAGDEIDAGAVDLDVRRIRALALRHSIERLAAGVVDRFGWFGGPRPLSFDAVVAQRYADTVLYLRQHGGARDLVALAHHALQREPRVDYLGWTR